MIQVREAYELLRIWAYADFQGSLPARTFARARSSCEPDSSTPGCSNVSYPRCGTTSRSDRATEAAELLGETTASTGSRAMVSRNDMARRIELLDGDLPSALGNITLRSQWITAPNPS